jgi:hypothetical protein
LIVEGPNQSGEVAYTWQNQRVGAAQTFGGLRSLRFDAKTMQSALD